MHKYLSTRAPLACLLFSKPPPVHQTTLNSPKQANLAQVTHFGSDPASCGAHQASVYRCQNSSAPSQPSHAVTAFPNVQLCSNWEVPCLSFCLSPKDNNNQPVFWIAPLSRLPLDHWQLGPPCLAPPRIGLIRERRQPMVRICRYRRRRRLPEAQRLDLVCFPE